MSDTNHSTSGLISDLLREVREVVSREMALAQLEISELASTSVRHAVGLLIGTAVAAAGGMVLLAAAVYALALAVPFWISALIVGGVVSLAGMIAAMIALNRFKQMKIEPEHTLASLREDKEWLKREKIEMTS
jgi:predicted phage tail protein